MIIGIDLGNRKVKTSTKKEFFSTVKLGHQTLNNEDIQVNYKGVDYTVGAPDGTAFRGPDRYFSEPYEVCFLTAIALSSQENKIDVKAVISIPPDLFNGKETRELIKAHLMGLDVKTITVKVGGVTRVCTIRIKGIEIFCESSVVYADPPKYRGRKTVIIDLGGGTADVSEFNGLKLIKNTSEQLGVMTLYDDMKSAVNSTFRTKLSAGDMEDIIGKDTYIIRQASRDVSFLKAVVKNHMNKIFNIVNQFNTDNSSIEFIGGGAKIEYLKTLMREQYQFIEIPEDAEFKNALTNYRVGAALWNE